MGAEVLIVVALLLAAAGRQQQQAAEPAGGSTPAPSAGAGEGGNPLADTLGVLGSAGAALGGSGLLGGGAVGGGSAAAGGGGAAVAGGGATAAVGGGKAAVGGTAAVGGGTTTLSGGGATVIAPVTGVAAPGAAIGVGAIVAVIVAFIIANQVVIAQESAKDFQGALLGNNIDAGALNRFEADVSRRILTLQGRTWTEELVRDFRLDRYITGQKLTVQGYRVVLRTLPRADDAEVFGRVRAMAYEFLRLRAMYGYRMIRSWGLPPNPPADWGWNLDLLGSVYERSVPGVGNLLGVPHALQGATVNPRSDPSEVLPPPLELVGNNTRLNYPSVTLTAEERQSAHVAALCDAALVLRWDTRGWENDPTMYARALVDAWQYGGNTVAGLEYAGHAARLDPAVFGREVCIYPARIRSGSGGIAIS